MGSTSNVNETAIRFVCSTCGRKLRAAAADSGKTIACPECRETLRVPDFAAEAGAAAPGAAPPVAGPKPRTRRPRNGLPPVVRDEEPRPSGHAMPPASPLDQLGVVREETPDPPPRWTFFSDVFESPFQAGMLPRWLCLSFGLALTLLVFCVVLSMAGALGGGVEMGAGGPVALVIAFFVLPLFWLGFYTFSYGAALSLAIVEDTAAGNRHVANWPEPNWKEWAATFLALGYLFAVTAALAWGVAVGVEQSTPEWKWPAMGLVILVIFPYFLLCGLEKGQFWLPLSGVVTGSTLPLWWAWLSFYVLAGATWIVWIASVWLVAIRLGAPFLAALVTAPVLGWAMLVTARLLGRLAWRIGERGVPIVDDDD